MFKKTLNKCLNLGASLKVCARVTRKTPKIFMFHQFTSDPNDNTKTFSEIFERQVRWVGENFNVYTVAKLNEYLSKNGRFPYNAVAITIDDGYRSVYELAFPILKKYRVPATFYVSTDFIEGHDWLWTDKLEYFFERSGMESVLIDREGQRIEFSYKSLKEYLKTIDFNQCEKIIKSLYKSKSLALPSDIPDKFRPCDWEQLKEMQDFGIEIGSHSLNHPCLTRLEHDEMLNQIYKSKSKLDNILGRKSRSFCYPNGQPEDYNDEIKKEIKMAGYEGAVVAFFDKYQLDIPFAWRRFSCVNSFEQFKGAASGAETLKNFVLNKVKAKY